MKVKSCASRILLFRGYIRCRAVAGGTAIGRKDLGATALSVVIQVAVGLVDFGSRSAAQGRGVNAFEGEIDIGR